MTIGFVWLMQTMTDLLWLQGFLLGSGNEEHLWICPSHALLLPHHGLDLLEEAIMKTLQRQSFDLSIDEHGEKNICNIYPIISAGTNVAGMPWSILNSDQEKAYQLHDQVSGEELNKYTFIQIYPCISINQFVIMFSSDLISTESFIWYLTQSFLIICMLDRVLSI